ncbi:hypothetical protein PV664_08320 [Streptomyces sp. ME01-18a]|uniref:hypothetical protein n=2 Tax=Streptomyces TaxID=1883 RepID=UPI0029A7D258|nr:MULTISPECIES: hypothetical protein [unclassified Streptomyces]MDX3428943.1 hypothetical protein [Streptomyces sp. ME01-18a]MDX3687257.1 hypothetical protein [Streptomyces sp. AK04-4c]WSS62074.1 hypothetical protein OG284_12925 [Streptomyces sp. NBC_01177]WSS76116.1 hypothetical protein OG414_13060 [Streptomyces sp. NBC_01174]
MADGADTGVREQGPGRIELRISLSGTHTRRDDVEALHAWLKNAPVLEGALKRDEVTLARKDSLTQAEAMGGELIQDIILVVSVEVARSVTENAWRSVETWLRNRRRFADPEETPRVTLDGPSRGPGSDLSRDTDDDTRRDTDPGDGDGVRGDTDSGDGGRGDTDGETRGGPGAGPGAGGGNRTRGGDEPGEV